METTAAMFRELENRLSDDQQKIHAYRNEIEKGLEALKCKMEQYEKKQEEIERLAQIRFEELLEQADINCEYNNGEKVIPTIDVLQDNYQSLRSSVKDVVTEIHQKASDLNEKTQPYRESLQEFVALTQQVEELENSNRLLEERLKNAPIRLKKNPTTNQISVGFLQNGEYLHGFRLDDTDDKEKLREEFKRKLELKK